MKRVLIVAGETSGDLHGAALMQAMKEALVDVEFAGIGGTRMEGEGLCPLRHVREMNFMGFVEVIRHLPLIRRTFRMMEHLVETWKPDLAILIDYPGFNLKLAASLKKRSIPVMYYISPQLWAWHRSRVRLVKKYVDRMVVLFDFEREFYRGYGVEADFVGHPLLDSVRPTVDHETFRRATGTESVPLVGLLPGSRVQEIRRILPAMAGAVPLLSRGRGPVKTVLGCAPDIEDRLYRDIIGNADIVMMRGRTYDIMAYADALVVTSGTATLEAGISGTPMTIVYRTSPFTFAAGKMLVKVPDIGLINIVAGRRIVPELWQDLVTPERIAESTLRFLNDDAYRSETKRLLVEASARLGASGASKRAVAIAREMLDQKRSAQ